MTYVTSWERIAEKKGRLEGKREGKREGIIEGERKGKLEIAKELIRNGVSIDIISKATGFSRDEIEELVTTVQ